MNLRAIKEALKNQIQSSVPSLGTRVSASDNVPALPWLAIGMPVTSPGHSMAARYASPANGEITVCLPLILELSAGNYDVTDGLLSDYLSDSGPESLYLAIAADPTLGGLDVCATFLGLWHIKVAGGAINAFFLVEVIAGLEEDAA